MEPITEQDIRTYSDEQILQWMEAIRRTQLVSDEEWLECNRQGGAVTDNGILRRHMHIDPLFSQNLSLFRTYAPAFIRRGRQIQQENYVINQRNAAAEALNTTETRTRVATPARRDWSENILNLVQTIAIIHLGGS